MKASIIPLAFGGFILLLWLLLKDATIDVLEPTGLIADEQRKLLYFTLGLSALVVVPVFTLLGLFAYKYREGRGAEHKPEQEGNYILEAVWWGIPIIIIVILAVVTWQTSHSLDPYKKIESDNPTISVQVVALQWKWLFIYPDYGIATVNHLPIPVDHPIHFTLAADAPMSAFWIPSLGSQVYSMNGMSSELNLIANKTGEYTGYNTNINGQGYAQMKFTTHVQSIEEFDEWTKRAAASDVRLTAATYEDLARPSVPDSTETYRLGEKNLYDTIVEKYMHAMPPTSSDGESATQHHHGGHR